MSRFSESNLVEIGSPHHTRLGINWTFLGGTRNESGVDGKCLSKLRPTFLLSEPSSSLFDSDQNLIDEPTRRGAHVRAEPQAENQLRKTAMPDGVRKVLAERGNFDWLVQK